MNLNSHLVSLQYSCNEFECVWYIPVITVSLQKLEKYWKDSHSFFLMIVYKSYNTCIPKCIYFKIFGLENIKNKMGKSG